MQPPFVGPSYNLESRPASVQRTINLVPVPLEPGNERSGWGFEDVPGLSQIPITAVVAPGTHGCYITEDFESGIGAYSTVSGDTSIYTAGADTYGTALHVGTQNAITQAIIHRTFGSVTATRVVVRFKVSDSPDDAAILGLYSVGVLQLGVIPRREGSVDALRRCYLYLGGESVITVSVTLDVWHELVIEMTAGAGNTTYQIENLSTVAVVASGNFAGNFASIDVDEIRFTADSGGPTCPTAYDDICIGF